MLLHDSLRGHGLSGELRAGDGGTLRFLSSEQLRHEDRHPLWSCPWASGDRFSEAIALVWEKQLVKEFPESELLSPLATLGFPDEKAWPKPSWATLRFSWLSFDLDELV